jgi:hypothetical protein
MKMMLQLHLDAMAGNMKNAELKEHANMYGKTVHAAKVQLEQKVFLKDKTPVKFLLDD